MLYNAITRFEGGGGGGGGGGSGLSDEQIAALKAEQVQFALHFAFFFFCASVNPFIFPYLLLRFAYFFFCFRFKAEQEQALREEIESQRLAVQVTLRKREKCSFAAKRHTNFYSIY